MKHILTVIGARPQIIKAAALSRAIRNCYADRLRETIVHTGQHYDANMSQVFLEELGVPAPGHNLEVGSGSHGVQTARMLEGIERILSDDRPDALLVYGDTNSTVAGSLAAIKLGIPVVHVEAGLRSFNKAMPEEVNRILTDHASTLLFTPTAAGLDNLKAEGFDTGAQAPFHADHPGVFHCGDVMYDNSLYFAGQAAHLKVAERHGVTGEYMLATCHRPSNTDSVEALNNVLGTLLEVSAHIPVLLPLHPRTCARLESLAPELLSRMQVSDTLHLIPPVSFLEMIDLEARCALVMTDSGGVQKEAFFFQKPCVILREQTEWVEIVDNGNALLAGADPARIREAFAQLRSAGSLTYPAFYGDGKAAEFIAARILDSLA